jgi:hypothetical protein
MTQGDRHQCVYSHCVGGVCCHTARGGDDESDCQAPSGMIQGHFLYVWKRGVDTAPL